MHLSVQAFYHSDWFRFVFCPLLAWFLSGLFLYGFVGPQWWRKQAQDYVESNFFIYRPDTLAHVVIWLLERIIPLAVVLWFAFHH